MRRCLRSWLLAGLAPRRDQGALQGTPSTKDPLLAELSQLSGRNWSALLRRAPARLEIDDGAREGARDTGDGLNACDDELAKFVHGSRLGSHDDVVRTGNVFRKCYSGNVADGLNDRGGFADFSLNEDIRLNAHAVTIAAAVPMPRRQ